MRLTVLVDNQAGHNLKAEWGLSIVVETENQKFLLDTGASPLFIDNAFHLEVSLADLDSLVLSHGHWDHSWGITDLIKYLLVNRPLDKGKPSLITHPLALTPKFRENGREFGIYLSEQTLSRHFQPSYQVEPFWLTENLVYLGEIKRRFPFENTEALGTIDRSGAHQPDYVRDDSALAYRTRDGLLIITGCSHSGICNIVAQAMEVCDDHRIVDIIGGFHLLNPHPEKLQQTVAYLRKINPAGIHPCHCTDLTSKIALAQYLNLSEVFSGFRLEYP